MSLREFVLSRRSDGTCSAFGGLVEFDPDWRARDLFAGYEPAQAGKVRKLTRAERLASLVCETNIEFILGKPGGGKSMFATKAVVDELLHSHRPIVTNLALNLVLLQEYVFSLGRFDIDVSSRVRLLEHEEVFRFYLIRGKTLELPAPSTSDGLIDFRPSQEDAEAAGGVFYVIDEAHNYFPTKAKIEEDSPMFKWASQHRKLKDYCYFVTQSVENVHVKVRRLAQLYNYIRNLRKETFRGFRRGDGFQRLAFLSIPTGKRDEDFAITNQKFALDVKGLASCYFTAGGVGVSGSGVADGGFKKKGMHYKWLYVGAGLAVVAVVCVFLLLPLMGAKLGAKVVESATGRDVTAPAAPSPAPALSAAVVQASPRAIAPVVSNPPPVLAQAAPAADPVRVVGVVRTDSVVNVILSDGRTLIESDPELGHLSRNGVMVEGRKLFFVRPVDRPAPAPVVAEKPATPPPPPDPEPLSDPEPVTASTWSTGRPGEGMRPGTFAPSSSFVRSDPVGVQSSGGTGRNRVTLADLERTSR